MKFLELAEMNIHKILEATRKLKIKLSSKRKRVSKLQSFFHYNLVDHHKTTRCMGIYQD